MKLRRCDIAGLPRLGDYLSASDSIAAFHVDLTIVGIGGHETIRMTDEHQIAVAFQIVAGIGNDARFRCLHRRSFRQSDVDSLVAARLIALNDSAARWPPEFRSA